MLAIYERDKVGLMKEVFIRACERSEDHYKPVRQTLGEPNAFALRYREELKILIAEVVLQLFDRHDAHHYIAQWSRSHFPTEDQTQFQEKAETELLSLHEGNFARYRIPPEQFEVWKKIGSAHRRENDTGSSILTILCDTSTPYMLLTGADVLLIERCQAG